MAELKEKAANSATQLSKILKGIGQMLDKQKSANIVSPPTFIPRGIYKSSAETEGAL